MARRAVQWIATIAQNGYLAGFFKGQVWDGSSKLVCVPGLNCYSCPGALASCPIGSLQAVAASRRFSFSYYVVGLLILFGVIFGRFICGFLCPFGLFQDLLHKIKTPKLRVAPAIDRPLRWFKFLVLLLPVLLLPALLSHGLGNGAPIFCKAICPVGTLEGALPLLLTNEGLRAATGTLFDVKLIILIAIVVLAVLIYRPFCKYLCPLGAFYGLFNKISFYQMSIDAHKCTGCNRCHKSCKMQAADQNSIECIRCGDCKKACPQGAIQSGFQLRVPDYAPRLKNKA